jgi:prepilin-type N-terminal cleavage/methylation domain-containing protein
LALSNHRGFTLIEILIASTIFAMILLGVYMVYETNQATYVRGEARANVQQNARVALDQMTRELLMAGFDPTRVLTNPAGYSTGLTISNYAMQSLGASTVRFLADVDGDSSTEVVEFTYDSTNKRINRQVWVWNTGTSTWTTAGAQAITENNSIDSLTFAYLDENNAVIASADYATKQYLVRRIEIALSATVKAGSEGTQSFALNSDVRPRNL